MRIALLSLCLTVASLQAEATGRMHALLVGINNYQSRAIPQLSSAVADAASVHDFLVDPKGPGCTPGEIVLMTDTSPAGKPTGQGIRAALERLAGGLTAGDTFIFYFAGHGINRHGEDYLLPIDSSLESEDALLKSAIPVSAVTNALLRAPARQVLFIVDACRDNRPTEGGIFGSALRIASSDAGDDADRVRATLSAVRPGQRAFEWPQVGHGVFTYYLLQGLQGAAAQDDGSVTADSLARYVQRQVSEWTKEHLKGRASQLPWLLKDGVAPLVLLRYPPHNLVSAQLDGVPLKQALLTLAKQVGHDLLLGPGVPETSPVTVTINQRPLQEALGLLLKPAGLSFEVQDKIIVVSRPTPPPATVAKAPAGPTGKDGMPLVLVPGGSFRRGSDRTSIEQDLKLPSKQGEPQEWMFWNELSDRDVSVDSFYLDEHEVTNAQYRNFVAAGGYRNRELWSDDGWAWLQTSKATQPAAWDDAERIADDQPVAGVSWFEADAYARWAGRRLPTEAEWEYAAQGGSGLRYDQGDVFDAYKMSVGLDRPAPVKSHPASPFGLYDLTGNVQEWCQDVYDPDFYRWGERFNPICVASLKVDQDITRRSVRGGGYDADAVTARVRKRSAMAPAERRVTTGFRCAADLRTVKGGGR